MQSWRQWRALAAHRTPLPLMVKHAYGRCPTRTQLSTRPLVTGHIWRRNTPQSPPKMGEGDYGRIPKGFCPLFDFGEEGRPTETIPWFFIFFPYLFYHRFLVSNCSKFCVKQMGSTVFLLSSAVLYMIYHFLNHFCNASSTIPGMYEQWLSFSSTSGGSSWMYWWESMMNTLEEQNNKKKKRKCAMPIR